ncbi:MAG: TIGR00269 family protein [Candidatus Nanoarchaeia archaeon]|nr:TIGR00269 family protein [Candidatus Haiyanarchaeum thermophilum]
MRCANDGRKAVAKISYPTIALCRDCFNSYVERRFLDEVRKWKLIEPNEKLALALSGGKDSLVALYLIHKFFPENEIIAIAIDEGIGKFRELSLLQAEKYCKLWDVDLRKFSFLEEFGFEIRSIARKVRNVCTYCGTLRRYLINKKARELRAQKVVVGHNLDDEAETILMSSFKSNLMDLLKLGPIAGILDHPKFIPRVKPLRKLYGKEIETFARLNGIKVVPKKCPYIKYSYRYGIRRLLNSLEAKEPGTKFRILEAFDESFPALKQKIKLEVKLSECKNCGEPSSTSLCRCCQLLRSVKLK